MGGGGGIVGLPECPIIPTTTFLFVLYHHQHPSLWMPHLKDRNLIDFPDALVYSLNEVFFQIQSCLSVPKSPKEEKAVLTNYRIVEMVKIYGTQGEGRLHSNQRGH